MGVGFGKVSDPLAFPFPSLLTCGSLAWSRGVGFLLQSSSGIFRRARFAQFSAHAAYAAPPTRPDPEIFFLNSVLSGNTQVCNSAFLLEPALKI